MNILYTSTSYLPATGGAQIHLHRLVSHLLEHHAVQVVSQWDTNRTDWLLGTTLRAPPRSYSYDIEGVKVHRIGLPMWQKVALAPFIPIYYPLMDIALPPIAACLERHLMSFASNADLVHNVRIGREGLSLASFHLAQRRGIPFVLTPVHHPRWVGWRYRAYLNLYRHADAVIALTKTERQILVSLGVREERIGVTGIGPILAAQDNPTRFRRLYDIGTNPMVLFLGQHYAYKGYRQVLEAAHLVWKQIPDAHFVFIGPAVKDSERSFTNVDQRIHRLGKVDLQTKTDALAACTLLCVPSTQESFGGVYTEAWMFAKPVIGCTIPAVQEVIADEVDGLLVQQTPNAIADRICMLLLDELLARRMGEAGRRKVEEHYTWQRIAERTEQVYQMLL